MNAPESQLEEDLLEKLRGLKYDHRPDPRANSLTSAALEANFRNHFQTLNQVKLTHAEFARLLDEIVTADVYAASKTLRTINSFTRDDGTPRDKDLSNYTLVNIKDWCKNTFEVARQLRINGVPVTQIELKTLGINPRRAMEQIVEYKNDPGNGYTRTLLCFVQPKLLQRVGLGGDSRIKQAYARVIGQNGSDWLQSAR